jgi:hypothetical protein
MARARCGAGQHPAGSPLKAASSYAQHIPAQAAAAPARSLYGRIEGPVDRTTFKTKKLADAWRA